MRIDHHMPGDTGVPAGGPSNGQDGSLCNKRHLSCGLQVHIKMISLNNQAGMKGIGVQIFLLLEVYFLPEYMHVITADLNVG